MNREMFANMGLALKHWIHINPQEECMHPMAVKTENKS